MKKNNDTKVKTKINSGSKTSNPKKSSQKILTGTIDINKVFDIIESETKRKEIAIKKEKKIKNIIDSISDNDVIDKTTENDNIECVNKINDKVINSFNEAKQFLKDHNITISTITLDCKLHTLIDVDKFSQNVELKEDEIVSVKFGDRKNPATNRTIVVLKTKKKPSTKNFYNQVTILMKPMNNPSRNYINIKVFKNGSLQMTGCKDMDDFNNVTMTLIKILKRGRDIKNKKGKIVHMDFINNPKEIGIYDTKVRMINSNFKLNYKVDRKKLAKLLKKNHDQGTIDKEIGYVECKYAPTSGHSCVNIKYRYDEKNKPSIFVFQTGAIIITGAKNFTQIIMAYHFIHKILNKYYNEIRIIDLDHKAVQAEIAKFFRNNKKINPNVYLVD
jgi:TATA-box binding protein (TBP) (component of TFIID and TFIIIB)